MRQGRKIEKHQYIQGGIDCRRRKTYQGIQDAAQDPRDLRAEAGEALYGNLPFRKVHRGNEMRRFLNQKIHPDTVLVIEFFMIAVCLVLAIYTYNL
jgi:hypothetical protein